VVGLVAFASERGESLVEILISVAIIAIVITAFLAALSTGAFSVALVRKQVTAENLARSQLEYVKNQDYITTTDYSLISVSPSYSAYTVTVQSFEISSGLQLITVTVFYDDKPTFTVEDYKVNR
jgi:type II secretory pathway pseudopilin PulG